MRTLLSIALTVSQDKDQRQKLIDQLITMDDIDAATASTFQSGEVNLAAGAGDTAFAFGSVTAADTVLIIAYQEVTVKFNAGGSPGTQQSFTVRPLPAVTTGNITSGFQTTIQPGVLLLRGKVTSIHIANPSGSTAAECFVALVGNAL